jgi:hypothetical protein
MYTYDAITKTGLHIHLSMNENADCYILVYDLYTYDIEMKFFTDQEAAKRFINSL